MTDLVANPDSNLHASPSLTGLLDGQLSTSGYLVITETTPQSDISVRLTINALGKLVPSFSSDGVEWFSAGIEWRPAMKVDTALFITFQFVPSTAPVPAITKITCPYAQVAYGPAMPRTGPATSQMISVLSSDEPVEFSFSVHPKHGPAIDPKIKITPP